MANAYLDGLKQFAANSQRDQALGRPTQMASTGLARTNPPLPPVTAMPPRPGTPNSPGNVAAPTRPPVATGPQVGWGSNAGQPRPGNTPYARPEAWQTGISGSGPSKMQPRMPAASLQDWQNAATEPYDPRFNQNQMAGSRQQYQQGMGQRPPTYPPQMRPNQQPFQYQQQGAQPWQAGNQYAPQPGGVPPWMQFAQRPNYQQQFNPYSMPTQGMVRPQTPGQGYDSFMGSWQNPMQGMINNRPTWRPSPAMPSIPQIPAMPQYQGPPNPWAQAVPSAQPAQQNQQSPTMADYLRVMRGY